jgi:hypothetical protein
MTEGDIALAHSDFAKAIDLYRAESMKPGLDAGRTHAAMVRSMLRGDKIKDAETEAHAWVAEAPADVWAQVALEEVQWREGKIAEAVTTMEKTSNIDPCNAQVHADFAEILRLSGLMASASKQSALARKLDPVDDDIETTWIELQPRSIQLTEVTAYLQRSSFLDEKERKSLERWKERLSQPPAEPCTLSNAVASTSIPYQVIQDGPYAKILWGLDVTFNGKVRRLEIDTGASGLTLTKAAASALHLQPDERIKISGIGDEGPVDSYVAKVQSIKIGSLVFQNCDVSVLTKTPEGMEAQDGLIGGDVFSSFLLTLDFPGRVLKLDPLPAIPNTKAGPLTLETGVADDRPVRDRYIDPSMASWTKVFRSGHNILLSVYLNDGPSHLFIMDTGSSLNLISPDAAREVGKVSSGSRAQIYGISGMVNKTYTTGPIKLTFGQLSQRTPGLLAIDTSDLGRETGVDVAGFLGAPTLHQLTVSIDYRDYLVTFAFDPKRLTRCASGINLTDCY